jgi:hypothetical protein
VPFVILPETVWYRFVGTSKWWAFEPESMNRFEKEVLLKRVVELAPSPGTQSDPFLSTSTERRVRSTHLKRGIKINMTKPRRTISERKKKG